MNMSHYPYFYARKREDEIEIRGISICRLGHEFLEGGQSHGPFVEWKWNGRRLEVHNDRYGFYPLYYWLTRER